MPGIDLGVFRQNHGNVNSVLIPRTPAARQCWEPQDSKALELVGIGFGHALRLEYSRFHRVGHVNCSGLPCRNGNFHLGRSPEHPISGLPAAPGQRELLPPRGAGQIGWRTWPQSGRHLLLPLSPGQVALTLRTFRTFQRHSGWPSPIACTRFRMSAPHSGSPLQSLQVPVEMAVLWSQPFLSQNGIVDAT